MVQLIRIVSNNETVTDVTNFFNESITIRPDSKIALESLKITLPEIITVDTINNTFQVQVSDKQPNFTVTLRYGLYSADDFIIELSRALNEASTYCFTPRNITVEQNATEWKPIYLDEKLIIQYATVIPDTGRDCNFSAGITTGSIVLQENNPTDGFNLGDSLECIAIPNNEYAWTVTERVLLNGPAEFRVIVKGENLTENTDFANCVIGLRSISEPQEEIIDIGQLQYAIATVVNENDERFIYAFVNGELFGSSNTLVPNTDYNIRITTSNGVVKFWVASIDENPNNAEQFYYQIARDPDFTGSVAYDYDEIFKGYILMGETNSLMYNICYTPSPYQNVNTSGLSIANLNSEIQDLETHIKYNNLGAAAQTATVHTLIMSDASKKLMGYVLNQYTVTSIFNQFIAERGVDLGRYSDEIIVELPSEFIKAYEGSQNRRRNIIRYVPADTTIQGAQRSHTFQYPLYLELQNKDQKIMNYFQVRLLDSTFTPIEIAGTPASMVCVLIVD